MSHGASYTEDSRNIFIHSWSMGTTIKMPARKHVYLSKHRGTHDDFSDFTAGAVTRLDLCVSVVMRPNHESAQRLSMVGRISLRFESHVAAHKS